jgi:uridine phosphorylase
MSEQQLPFLRARASQIAERALVVGDPNRAEMCASLLDDAEELGFFREYRTFTGIYEGTPITVCSHGVGSAGACIPFHELFLGGVKSIIRAGTCGAMQKGIPDGSTVIATGAVRQDGTTPGLVPMEYPAVAHFQVVNALMDASQKNGIANPYHGIVLSSANFYPGPLDEMKFSWMDTNVIAVEMEASALFVMASLRGLRAGAILTTDGNLAEKQSKTELEDYSYDPHRDVVKQGTQKMLEIALQALVALD